MDHVTKIEDKIMDHVTKETKTNMYIKDEMTLDHRNRFIENYMTIEFVAIPPDFDIVSYLSMREQAGIFESKKINVEHLKIIAEGVKSSPVFMMLNNIRIDPITCLYFLKIINELGLVLKSLYNPMRENIDQYIKQFILRETVEPYTTHKTFIKGQQVQTINFAIVNIFPMMNEDVINESMQIAAELQKYQTDLEEKIESINDIK